MTKLLSIFLLAASLAFGQATMPSTTLSAAMTATDRTLTVAAVTGGTPTVTITAPGSLGQIQTILVIDKEVMRVLAVNGTRLTVERAYSGKTTRHASGQTVYFGPATYFAYHEDPFGPCTSTSEFVLPVVVAETGNIYQCTNNAWVLTGSAWGAVTGTGSYVLSSGPTFGGQDAVIFEGATANDFETTLRIEDPTADRIHTIPNVASDTFAMVAATQTLTGKTLTSPAITTDIRPTAAGGSTVGTAALPFSSVYIGGDGNTGQLTGTFAADRALTVPDPGGADTFVMLALAQTLTSKTLTSPAITTDIRPTAAGGSTVGTAALPFSSVYIGSDGNTGQLTGTFTADRAITFPDAAQTIGSKTASWAQGNTVANAVSTQFFIADRAYTVTGIKAVWGTAESTGAMDIMVERLSGVTACGSGNDLQAAVVDATGAANTTASPSLTATTAFLSLAAGDRLCVTLTATPNEVRDIAVTVAMVPAN